MTNAKARFSKSLHPRKREGSLGRTAQAVHLRRLSHSRLLNWLWFGQFACPDQYRVDYLRTPWSAHSPDCNKGPVLGGDGINICCITVGESVSGAAAGSRSRPWTAGSAQLSGAARPRRRGQSPLSEWWTMGDRYVLDFAPGLRSLQSLCKSEAVSVWSTRHPRPPTLKPHIIVIGMSSCISGIQKDHIRTALTDSRPCGRSPADIQSSGLGRGSNFRRPSLTQCRVTIHQSVRVLKISTQWRLDTNDTKDYNWSIRLYYGRSRGGRNTGWSDSFKNLDHWYSVSLSVTLETLKI